MSSHDPEKVLSNVVQFLVDGREMDAASVLLSCTFLYWSDEIVDPEFIPGWHVELTCPRGAYDALTNPSLPIKQQIEKAFDAVFTSFGTIFCGVSIGASLSEVDPNWRSELLDIARGKSIHNQIANATESTKHWNNLRFRSVSEIRIAQALDHAGVLFLPNCKARLSTPQGRANKEADFLICVEGRWGILEVDGEPYHPASRTVEDHERDRLFRTYGVRVVEHFDSGECFENAKGVVERFLEILRKAS